jgi:anthranilate phosphoribosyltransferase
VTPTPLARLLDPAPLTPAAARAVFDALLAPSTTEAMRCALIVALTARADDGREWAALAGELRRRAVAFRAPGSETALDLCGSGGARSPSFNVSTVAAFVVAASGQKVIKHGNRSARGPSGSSDLLLALGLPVDADVAYAQTTFERTGLAFLHAPLFHPAMAAVRAARQELGVPTVFNRLGPLSNPARVRRQVVGWGDRAQGPVVASALRRLGVRRGLTMASEEGCDEFSPRRRTYVRSWADRGERTSILRPERLLLPEERKGSWGPLLPEAAAEETERILAGGDGARRGSVLLTAGAGLWVAGRAPSLAEGVACAREVLDEGAPERLLARLRELARPYRAKVGP